MSDVLLNVPTMDGTSSVKGFNGWIDVNAYSFGVKDPVSLGGRGRAVASNLQFTKSVDATSPLFADAYFSNKPFTGSTKLYVVTTKNGQSSATTMQILLHNATVVADSTAAGRSGQNETISMSYDAIQYCVPQPPKSMVCQAWNFKTNTSSYPTERR